MHRPIVSTTQKAKSIAKMYAGSIPAGSKIMGLLRRPTGEQGACAKLHNGVVVQINCGVIRALGEVIFK